jgi:predicted SnoaL-like aldol condensation-catalyzing enzyme
VSRFVTLVGAVSIAVLSMFPVPPRTALAAGAVEMQVERIVSLSIEEYNQAMEAGDPEGWFKYFADNVRRDAPTSAQEGKQAFADYYRWEFQNFQARWVTKKILVSGRSAAVVFVWEAIHRPSGTAVKLDMVGVYELASSGKFESVAFYYDTAKVAQLLASSGAVGR